MKAKFLKIALTVFLIFLFSCSKDDDTVPEPTTVNKALIGLFDIKLNGTTDSNLLFEIGNHVTYGYPTVTEMLSQVGRRSTYTITNNEITFSNTDGASTYNFKCTFEPTTGKLINGTIGTGTNFTGAGTFTGQKHMPTTSGNDLFKGYWVGKYGEGSMTPNINFYMTFEESGKLVVSYSGTYTFENSSKVGYGTYTISGNSISGNYIYNVGDPTVSFTGNYDSATKKITGNWDSGGNLGTFYLDMKNSD